MSARAFVFLVFLGDLAVVVGAIALSYLLRFPHGETPVSLRTILEERTGASVLTCAVYPLFLYLFDAYNPGRRFRSGRGVAAVLAAGLGAFVSLAVLFFLIRNWFFGRGVFALQFAVALPGFLILRIALEAARDRLPARSRLLLVGAGPGAGFVLQECATKGSDFEVAGVYSPRDPGEAVQKSGVAVDRAPGSLERLRAEWKADLVVTALEPEDLRDDALVREVLACIAGGGAVLSMPGFVKYVAGKVPIYHVQGHWFLAEGGFDVPRRPVFRNLLRLVDVFGSLLGLLLSLPLYPLIALAIALTSRGPVFFRQTRLGMGKKPFTILKFRTMRQDAEANGAVWAVPGKDPRVTAVGAFLRRSRLDEIPQLWNVLGGSMSLLGPRPERPEFVAQLEKEIPFYDLRFAVRPGITGWAQVNFRYGASVDDAAVKLQYDLYFIQELTLFLVLRIVLQTVRTVFLRPGS